MLEKLERFFHIFYQFTGNKKGNYCRWKFSVFIKFPMNREKFEITFPTWLMIYSKYQFNFNITNLITLMKLLMILHILMKQGNSEKYVDN